MVVRPVTAKSRQVKVPKASVGSSVTRIELAATDAATGIGGYRVAESEGAVIVTVPAEDAPPGPTAKTNFVTRTPCNCEAAVRYDVISVSRIMGFP